MASPFSFPLLDLPSAALLHVFSHVRELRDAVALSLACKELWALGGPARRRHVCCAACGHAVLQAAVAFASDTHRDAPHLSLPDGDSWGVDVEHMAPGCTLGEEQELDMFEMLFALRVELGLRRAGDEGYAVRAQEVRCACCGLHLGLRITQLHKLRAGSAASCSRYWRELQVLGVAFLAKDLLRLHAPDDGREEHLGRPPSPAQLALYRCTGARSPLRKEGEGCGAPLFQRRDVLSRQHRWDAGGGPEHAFYVNALRKGAVLVRNERQEELSQGPMRVADVYCTACAARIGWRFCADLAPGITNCHQVGRFGVVKSSITKEAAADGSGGSSDGNDSDASLGDIDILEIWPPPALQA